MSKPGEKELSFHIPDMCTKQLKVQEFAGGKKKIVVSTNFLPIFGFEAGALVEERVLGEGKGIEVILKDANATSGKKVYKRTYKHRRNNPIETLLDIRSQSKLSEALGDTCTRVHITFTKGRVTIVPLTDKKAERIARAKKSSPEDLLSAFVACSSGMDAYSLANKGFRLDALLEYRPIEKRDLKNKKLSDFSETGAMCAAANNRFGAILNEDIFEIDTQLISDLTTKNNTSLFSISTQCDDFSNCKAPGTIAKQCELDNVNDMVYDALRIIEAGKFNFILLENVPNYLKTDYHSLFRQKLLRWGYDVHEAIIDASEHGGSSKRKRAYVFATTFDDVPFSFPEKELGSQSFWKEHVAPFLDDCREVSHCKSIQDGAACGRLRIVDKNSSAYPTLLKSQSRQAKDSLVIRHEGKFLFPGEKMERHIMGLPSSFSLEAVSKTIGSEILGQGVEYLSHSSIVKSIKKHIALASKSLHVPLRQAVLPFVY